MAKKFYAVARGREGSGIYLDWPTTEKNVKGISGIRYKSFPDEASALEFIQDQGVPREEIRLFYGKEPELKVDRRKRQSGKEQPQVDQTVKKPGIFNSSGRSAFKAETMTAYVDGSFRQGYSVYGYGVVIVAEDELLESFSGYGSRPDYVTMRNVAGEVLGAVKAMEYAMEKGARELILHFDYQGIESWAKGTWKRNNDLTRGYHEYVGEISGRLKVTFRKVKGHSGDRFNDLADELAKQAVMSSVPKGQHTGS